MYLNKLVLQSKNNLTFGLKWVFFLIKELKGNSSQSQKKEKE